MGDVLHLLVQTTAATRERAPSNRIKAQILNWILVVWIKRGTISFFKSRKKEKRKKAMKFTKTEATKNKEKEIRQRD